MKKIYALIILFNATSATAQNVGIGTPNPQNKLHVAGGFRLDTLTGVNGAGLLRHDANGVVYGIKFSGNSNDVLRGDGTFGTYNINGSIGWLLNGNSGTNPATNFLGTIDDQPLVFRVNNIRHGYLNSKNIFWGNGAGINNTGIENIAIGTGALAKNTKNRLIAIGDSALYNNLGNSIISSSAPNNIAIGYKALYANINGESNIAVGSSSLEKNQGRDNVAIGVSVLNNNINGSNNSALGNFAMRQNTSGSSNAAFGYAALTNNTTGSQNTAIGLSAMHNNSIGLQNTAVGFESLALNLGSNNSAVGHSALRNNGNGARNSAFGVYALQNNNGGEDNCAFGYNALNRNTSTSNSGFGNYALYLNTSGLNNTAFGSAALGNNVAGFHNTAVGSFAGNFLPNNIINSTCIGYLTGWNTTSSNQVNIGNFSVSWIGGQTGWFHYSDRRIKNDIKDDVPGLSFITRLKPITYHVDIDKQEEIANGKNETNSELIKPVQKNWEGKYDVEKIKMTGFFAQDVEDAAKAINYSFSGVYNPKNGGLLSIDYSAFVVPLVKAVQEQQAIIDKQQKLIDELLKRVEALEKK